jgi:ATP-binding cassette subfamily B protein
MLFNDTIYYNIKYGAVSKSKEERTLTVEQAAIEAKLHNFIISLPEGYETKVGER